MRSCLLLIVYLACSLSQAAEPLRIGFGSHKPPYIFEGEPRGLEYEIVAAAAAQAGMQLDVLYMPMERLHLLLGRGELDAIATTTPQSGVQAYYSDPYIEYHNVVVALSKRRLQLHSIAELGNYSISSFQRARYFLGSEFQVMAEHNPRYREEASQINRNRLLYAGRVDLLIGDQRILRYLNPLVADQVDVSQPITVYSLFPPTAYCLGFRQEQQRDLFNQGLKAIRENGEYLRIEQKYAEQ